MTDRSTAPPPAPLPSPPSSPPHPLTAGPPPMRWSYARAIDPWTGHREPNRRSVRPGSRLDQALTVARRATARPGPEEIPRNGGSPNSSVPRAGASVIGVFPDRSRAPAPAFAAVPAPAPPPLVTEIGTTPAPAGPATRPRHDYGLGEKWGSTWRWTAQGWVDRDPAHPTWRPVVTTTVDFPEWAVDTYLGVVAGEAAVTEVDDARRLGQALAEGREVALEALVDGAVRRGAHAVVGTDLAYTPLNGKIIVTATGTAVTLRER